MVWMIWVASDHTIAGMETSDDLAKEFEDKVISIDPTLYCDLKIC